MVVMKRVVMYYQKLVDGFYDRWRSMYFFALTMMLFLISCSAATTPVEHASPTSSITRQTTKPVLASGTLLYQADWAHGLDGWPASSVWELHDGTLQTTGADQLMITSPYHIKVSNYAVDVRIQVVSIAHTGANLSLKAEKASGKDGYIASVLNLLNPGQYPNGLHPQAQVYLDPMGSMEQGSFETIDYDPKFQPHTYRVEVRDASVSFFIDGNAVSDATSINTNHLSNGPIEIHSSLAVLRVSSFRISTL